MFSQSKFCGMTYRKSFDPGGYLCGVSAIAGIQLTNTMILLLLCTVLNAWFVSGEVDTNIRLGARSASGMGRVFRQESPRLSLEHRADPLSDHAITSLSGGHHDDRASGVSSNAATTSLSAADARFQTSNPSHRRTRISKGSPVYFNKQKIISDIPIQKLPNNDTSNNAIHVNKKEINIPHDFDLQKDLVSIQGKVHSILHKAPDVSQIRGYTQHSDSSSETISLSSHGLKKHTLFRRQVEEPPDTTTVGTPQTEIAKQEPEDANKNSSASATQSTAPADSNKDGDTTLLSANSKPDGKASPTMLPISKPATVGIKGDGEADAASTTSSKASLAANQASVTHPLATTAKKSGPIATSAAGEGATRSSALRHTTGGSNAACDQAQCFASRLPYHWTTDASWALASITFLLCVLTFFVLYTGLWKKRNTMGYPLENINRPNPHRRINIAELLRSKLAKIPHRLRNKRQNYGKKINGRRYEELPLRLPNGSCYDEDEEMDIFEDEEEDLYFRDEHTV